MAEKGFDISVYNRTYAKTEAAVARAKKSGLGEKLHGYEEMKDFVQSLEKPRCTKRRLHLHDVAMCKCALQPPDDIRSPAATSRRVIMLVMAGKPVDATIELLLEHLEEGDCIIDGGNEWCAASSALCVHCPKTLWLCQTCRWT